MQVFDINLKPKEARIVDVQASYVYFLNGSAGGGDTTISVTPTGGGETVYLKPGQAYKVAGAAPSAGRWTISNLKGEGTIVGQVMMGEGEFSDNRISGSVEMIDGGRARSLSGQSFGALAIAGAAPGGSWFGHAQLWNPANTGKRLMIGGVMLSNKGNADMSLYSWNTPLPNVLQPGSPGGRNVQGKYQGAVSVAQSLVSHEATTLGTEAGMHMGGIVATTMFEKRFLEPIVLDPGQGLLVVCHAPNVQLNSYFEYFEESL